MAMYIHIRGYKTRQNYKKENGCIGHINQNRKGLKITQKTIRFDLD